MATLRAKPLVQLGVTAQDCSSSVGAVPAPCEPCRQVTRWMPRTITWTGAAASKFKSIMHTILRGHDEILSSLCGFCADQATTSCDCFVAEYTLLGLPLTVEIDNTPGDCLCVYEDTIINAPCVGEFATVCIRCRPVHMCSYCETVEMDPCNNPVHLDLMLRAVNASKAGFGKRPTGDNMLAVIKALFPDTDPLIRQVELGTIYVDIGRDFTSVEIQFLRYLTALVPLGFGASIKFVTLC